MCENKLDRNKLFIENFGRKIRLTVYQSSLDVQKGCVEILMSPIFRSEIEIKDRDAYQLFIDVEKIEG